MEIRELDGDIGVLISGDGTVTDDEYLSAMEKHLSNRERLRKCKYSISDFSRVTDILVSSDSIRRMAKLCIHVAHDSPQILVAQVGDRDIIYGLQRIW